MPQKITPVAPRSAEEAADDFRSYTKAAGEGRRIRVAIKESPFRTGEEEASSDELILATHAGMTKIVEVSKEDFLAVVEGGVTFEALDEAVRQAGLYFPHEPGPKTGALTIAALIMGGMTFRTERRFGRLREYILALEIATPGGEVIRTGSRAVKDVTGYDITGFLVGGGGRCGMIVRATIRLLPAPGTRFGFECEGPREALEAFRGEIVRRLAPAFVETIAGEGGPAWDGRHPLGDGAWPPVSTGSSKLIGELQSAAAGREKELQDDLSARAPAEIRISPLDIPALAEMGTGGGTFPEYREPGELESGLYRVFDPSGIMLP